MKINRETYLDRVYACWTGKNIGGTMGTPYEGKTEMQDINGFSSPKGTPLGNDDLDLQLIWLSAVEERGIKNVTPQLLGEYWINYIPPHWNEYGIGKANMKLGLIPPLSGEYQNDKWKNSNGAWIRTEIWACLFPGFPQLAVKYAYNDACVDHGLGEGTYAAMFVAALESAAFFNNDIPSLIDGALSYIPQSSRVYKSVKLAISLYESKTELTKARNTIVADTADLGWFQAPANVAFVILGLLYGEGDYKKSMIYAINCGDDTDCTGATIGSLMGIMHGGKYVPTDWAEYIGDSINSVAIDLSYPKRATTCHELTNRVANLMPVVLGTFGIYTVLTDGATELEPLPDSLKIMNLEIPSTGLSFDMPDLIFAKGRVELDKITVKPGDTVKVDFIFLNRTYAPKRVNIKFINMPEDWTVDKKEFNVYLHQNLDLLFSGSASIVVGETVMSSNKIYVEVSSPERPTTSIFPIIICG